MNLYATSTFGIESIVAKELKNLGYDAEIENGKISFTGDYNAIAKTNLWLRSADKVFLQIGQFKATSFEELFQGIKSLFWSKYLDEFSMFPIADAKSVKSKLFSLSDIQSISKKAIVENLKEVYNVNWFEEKGVKYPIHVSILNDIVSVSINTSGEGLHKRGYREKASKAPLKETLAAAMINLSYWNTSRTLVDFCCGSGTIPIEAALIGLNIAPGLNRKFIAEDFKFIPKEVWKEERKLAYSAIDYDKELHIYGSDIDEHIIEIAKENAENAGVDENISFEAMDLTKFYSKEANGIIISNPPYGERLSTLGEVKNLYRNMGAIYKKLDNWNMYTLTSFEEFQKHFGKSANKNRKVYNGNKKCYYYQYFGSKPKK